MKKIFLLSAATLIMTLWSENVCARSWRINPNSEAKANFESINAAMESLEVFSGDTLYLDPGCTLPTQTITKSVTVIGTGFNLNDNPFIKESVINGSLDINTSNVKVEGCYVNYLIINDNCNETTIERCKLGKVVMSSSCTQTRFLSCYIVGVFEGDVVGYSITTDVEISNCIVTGGINNLVSATIRNNVIVVKGTTSDQYTSDQAYMLQNVTSSSITNNIIINTNEEYGVDETQIPYYYKNRTIKNVALEDNNTINRNVLSTDAEHAFVNYPDNKYIGATVEDVFVMEGGVGAMYQLKEGSPAIGYGTNGYDCGAFSGPYPYVVSGRPRFIPYIYEANIPNQPTDGKLNITLKIKSQNE